MASGKRLTLLRHARAESGNDSIHDRERALDTRGEREAPAMGQRLRASGARPSLILTSPAVRALQTARLVAQELNYPQEFLQREHDLYLASPAEILRVLARQDNAFNDVLLCGHNPGLAELAHRLTGGRISNLPTCGLVSVESPVDNWSDLAEDARLLLFDFPGNPEIPDTGS